MKERTKEIHVGRKKKEKKKEILKGKRKKAKNSDRKKETINFIIRVKQWAKFQETAIEPFVLVTV